jgi:hypothetical protein
MTRRAPAAALAAIGLATGIAACGGGPRAVQGTPHHKLPPPYFGPSRPLLKLNFDAAPPDAESWSSHPVARAGHEIALRLRIRNGGAVQTGDVLVRLHLPRSLQVLPATVVQRNVGGTEPGDPLVQFGDITAAGVSLGPFPAYSATRVQMLVRAKGSGPVRATATVSAPQTSAADTLTVRLLGR